MGYLSLSHSGAELLFQIIADHYGRSAALLDRLAHRCHIFEMNGGSYRFRESMKAKKDANKGRKSR